MGIFSNRPVYPFGQPPEGVDVLWRAEAKGYSVPIDPDRDIYGVSDLQLELRWYRVEKRTPCGVWVSGRFVNLNRKKRYASPTEAEALAAFKARKESQIRILTGQLNSAKQELDLLEGVI